MALTIYKISEYVDWSIDGHGGGGGGGSTIMSPVDLSNYYTKTELNTAGLSIVDWANIANYPYIYTFPSSVDSIGNAIQLENDELNPGNNQYYGTNAAGIKGWWPLIGGTGGALLPRNQILYWNVAQNWYQPYPAKPIPGGGGGGGGTLIGGALYNWAAAKGISEQPPVNNEALELTFDDIVNNPYATVAEWNTFFDLPNYGVPFTSMSITGDTVRLFGSYEFTIIVKEELFSQEPFTSHLIGVDDKKGCIKEVKYFSFYGLNYVTVLKFPMLATVGVESFSGCGFSAPIPGITSDFHSVITVGTYSFSASTFLSFNFPVLNVAGDYSFSSQGYCTNISMPSLLHAGGSCFYGLIVIEDISLPNLLSAGSSCFASCIALKTINLPKCTEVGSDLFNGVNTLTYISMPAVTDLGGTTGDDNVFYQTGTTLTLVIPAAMTTDGDVTWLTTNNTVILPNNILILTFDDIANASGMIGGDATLLDDWNTAFDSPVHPFTSINVVGNVVTLKGGSDITVPDGLFSTDWDEYGHLISVIDSDCIVAAGYNSFGDYDVDSNGTVLETAILPAMVTAGEGCFYDSSGSGQLVTVDFSALTTAGTRCFNSCTGLVNPNFSSLTTAGDWCFANCYGLVNSDFSSLTTAGDYCFYYCTLFTSMNFPVLASLGTTSGNDNVFNGITGNAVITLTIPAYFATNNAGGVDGDIADLIANNTLVNITYIHNLVLTFDLLANASGMIGGDATLLADWNLAFGSPASPFISITVVGNVVTLIGGSGITVPDSLFSTDWDYYGHLISIVDSGCIAAAGYNSFGDYDVDSSGTILETVILPVLTQAGQGCFYYSQVLTTISLPSLTTAGDYCFESCTSVTTISLPSLTTAGYSCFASCISVTTISLPSLTTVLSYCFYDCASLTTISLPSLTTAGESCFYICGSSLTTINLPVLTSLGSTVGENGVFYCISGKVITLTIPSALMTNNGGNPDGDIQYLTTYNTVTIINT